MNRKKKAKKSWKKAGKAYREQIKNKIRLTHEHAFPVVPPPCPACGSPAVLIETAIYNKWVCARYPDCNYSVSCHPNSKRACGTLASPELRRMRQQCHILFDPLWREKRAFHSRDEAYNYMAERMGLPSHLCHIGMFNVLQCQKFIDICYEIMKRAS